MTSYVQGKQLTIVPGGEIDHHRAKQIMTEIGNKIQEYLPKNCRLDFSDVSFMDSSGIAIVIFALRRMQELQGSLELTGVSAQPGKVLLAAGVDRLVNIQYGGNTL